MTDEPATASNAEAATGDADEDSSRERNRNESPDSRTEKIVEYVEVGALVVLALLGVVAMFGAYASAMGAIDIWIADDYRPIFRTAFNLVVLGLVAIGISLLVRRRFED